MISTAKPEIIRRPEYTLENLGRVFVVFRDFGIEMTEEEQYELDQLFCGIDYTDQLIDDSSTMPEEIALNILFYLTEKNIELDAQIPVNVRENLTFLQGIIAHNNTGRELEKVVRELLLIHEQLCKTNSIREYTQLTKQEGVKHAEIAFLFIRRELSVRIREFFVLANVLGNLADNLLDLEADFFERKISITPTKRLKLALRVELFKVMVALAQRYPKKRNAAKLAGKYFRYSLRV